MKTLIILGVAIFSLAIIGMVFAGVSSITAESTDTQETNSNYCSDSCGNSCTSESNCGLSTCGAVSGSSCGCR